MNNTVTIQVLRQDDPEGSPYWQTFEVALSAGLTVIGALREIRKRPVTADGQAIPPVVYESGCLSGVCGSCAMIVNGKATQACEVLLTDLTRPIRIEPLSAFPVQRDLIVNRLAILDAVAKVSAWSAMDGTYPAGVASAATLGIVDARSATLGACTSCGICLDACPQVNSRSAYLGPFAMTQAQLFNQLPVGRALTAERMDVILDESGIAGCGNAQNCVHACPKGLPLTEVLADVNRAATGEIFKRMLG